MQEMLSKWPPKKLNWLFFVVFFPQTNRLVGSLQWWFPAHHACEGGWRLSNVIESIVVAADTPQDFLQDSPVFLIWLDEISRAVCTVVTGP